MSTGTEIIELIRKQALLMQGTGLELAVVTSGMPLVIKIEHMDMELSEEFLLLSDKFAEHGVNVSSGNLNINATTTKEDLHTHDVFSADIHSGEIIVSSPLKAGDQVVVMPMYQGQKYYILDRVVL